MKQITLTNGSTVILDEDDFEALPKRRWYMTDNGYAAAKIGKRMVRMHRYLLGLTIGDTRIVDHINGDRLDNRRCNLRICNGSQNNMNSRTHSDNVSGLKGVAWDKRPGKWIARISVNGKQKFLGSYERPEEAHEVYCLWAEMIYGEFYNPGYTKSA